MSASSNGPRRKLPAAFLQVQPDTLTATAVVGWLADLPLRFLVPADGVASAREICRGAGPDVVLVDTSLPDGDAIELAEGIAANRRGAERILLLTSCTDDAFLYRASISSALDGVVWRSPELRVELRAAVTAVLEGRKALSPHFMEAVRALERQPLAFFKILSDREISMLFHFGAGRDDDDIAALTGLTASTVQTHRKRTMNKLGLHNIRELMCWSFQKGFVPHKSAIPEPWSQCSPKSR